MAAADPATTGACSVFTRFFRAVTAPKHEGGRSGWIYAYMAIVAAFLAVCIVGMTPAFAEPDVSLQTVTYPVRGRTAVEIRQSLNRNTPVRLDGNPFDAYTKWDVDWRFQWFENSDGTCRLTKVSTHLRIRTTLPGLLDPDSLSPDVADRWRRYTQALIAHENGHADIGVAAAREIEHELMRLEQQPTCDQLTDSANKLAREIIARHARMETRYDTDTRFGATDGANFP